MFAFSYVHHIFNSSSISLPPYNVGQLIIQVNNITFESLSPNRQKNYLTYVKKIKDEMLSGRQSIIATVELDRPGTNWSQTIRWDSCVSLRCQGPEIFIFSLYDMDKEPLDRDLHCFLTNGQRFSMIGHDASYHYNFNSQRASRTATGNAYTMPMLASAMIPLAHQAIVSGVCTNPKQPALNECQILELITKKNSKRRRVAN